MNKSFLLYFLCLISFVSISQNQLPLMNGNFEALDEETGNFNYWSNIQIGGGQAIYSISTENLIPGSSKAQKSEIISLGTNGWHIKTQSDYLFEVEAEQSYTVRFWAKVENSNSATIKVVFQAPNIAGSYQGNDIEISQDWQQYTHTFTVIQDADENKLNFWYMDSDVTYFLDEVEVVAGNSISFNDAITYQTVDGFGAGIKRRTEHLYSLEDELRQQIESYAFEELEANMIRFFVYHDLEDPNDNDNPFYLNNSALNWTRYNSNPNFNTTRYVAQALNNAFDLSPYGFDHIIGNCNSAPAWLKTNNSHNNGGTLISGGEDEFSEFLVAFVKGMESNYGINVTAISPTNEPDYNVTYESMNTTPSELSSILININERLENELLNNVNILSPEGFRVSSSDPNKSTTNYVNQMFLNPDVISSVDIVATHTYQNIINNSEWTGLKTVSLDKPIWVTEAGNLHSPNFDMADASYHIDRIIDGFNYGGLTAYMFHLFYEQHEYQNEVNQGENYGSSALVLWDSNMNIILPKRYYVFKHFTNLVKKDYQRIHLNSFGNSLKSLAFRSPDGSKIIIQLFGEDIQNNFDLEIPFGTTDVEHFITSDNSIHNFSSQSTDHIDLQANHITMSVEPMTMQSLVFTIDTSLSSILDSPFENKMKLKLFPNPVQSKIELCFENSYPREISIFQANGTEVYNKNFTPMNSIDIDVDFLSCGLYILKSTTQDSQEVIKFVIVNQ
jgi:O-glycosyl hydrolase